MGTSEEEALKDHKDHTRAEEDNNDEEKVIDTGGDGERGEGEVQEDVGKGDELMTTDFVFVRGNAKIEDKHDVEQQESEQIKNEKDMNKEVRNEQKKLEEHGNPENITSADEGLKEEENQDQEENRTRKSQQLESTEHLALSSIRSGPQWNFEPLSENVDEPDTPESPCPKRPVWYCGGARCVATADGGKSDISDNASECSEDTIDSVFEGNEEKDEREEKGENISFEHSVALQHCGREVKAIISKSRGGEFRFLNPVIKPYMSARRQSIKATTEQKQNHLNKEIVIRQDSSENGNINKAEAVRGQGHDHAEIEAQDQVQEQQSKQEGEEYDEHEEERCRGQDDRLTDSEEQTGSPANNIPHSTKSRRSKQKEGYRLGKWFDPETGLEVLGEDVWVARKHKSSRHSHRSSSSSRRRTRR